MAPACSKCNKSVDLGRIDYSVCKQSVHYQCVPLADSTYSRMSTIRKRNWKCANCKINSSTPSNTDTEDEGLKEYMAKKFNLLEVALAEQKDEVINALNLKVRELEDKLLKRDAIVAELEDRIDMLENRARNANIEIRNMPETQNEDVTLIVEEIGRTIGILDLKAGDIQVAHRVKNRDGTKGNRPIVAHLSSRFMRNKWLANFKDFKKEKGFLTAKNVNGSLPETRIAIYEHITVKKKLLLKEVREFAREKQIKFVWIKDGLILVRKNEGDKRVIKINTKSELEQFKANF
ncbi:hypothetical protein M8J77_000934 [Diaphorina citri]|nr:hypothetical protein M8J77_000934 [Diaphorina citri]